MMDSNALEIANQLMCQTDTTILTTIDTTNSPQTRAMLNLRNSNNFPGLIPQFQSHQKDFYCLFTTNMSSAKVEHIKQNPAVSVYFCTPNQWTGLMLGGKIMIVTDSNFKKNLWQPEWKQYYPNGMNDPDYCVLALLPTQVKLYHQLQFHEFNLKSNHNG